MAVIANVLSTSVLTISHPSGTFLHTHISFALNNIPTSLHLLSQTQLSTHTIHLLGTEGLHLTDTSHNNNNNYQVLAK